MTPLGKYANTVTPPADPEAQPEREAPRAGWLRREKWRLREAAGRFLPKPDSAEGTRWHADGFPVETLGRVARCGRQLVGGAATVLVTGEGAGCKARIVGVETCGSVWLCPCCSAKIAEHRRAEIETMLGNHVAGRWREENTALRAVGNFPLDLRTLWREGRPGGVYMATLTIPHARWDSLRRLRDGVADAWRRLVNGAPWARACARYGVVGVIRAMEVTHGRNGWHPHLHVLILADSLPKASEARLRDWIAERWARIAYRMGLADEDKAWDVYEVGVEMHRANAVQEAGDYVAKWGCDAELTKWHVKRAAGKNRSPWQLLADAADGDPEARMRWREYAAVFAGTRHLTMSRGLRDRYLDDAPLSDEQVAALDHGIDPAEIITSTGETIAGRLRRGVWVRVIRAGLVVDVLEAVEAGGWEAALALLRDKGLALRRDHG